MEEANDKLMEPRAVIGALLATMRLHRKHTERFVRETGLHPTQHRVLMYLARASEPCRQREISDHFELTPAAVAQILDKLEGAGYITREASDEDNRCKCVALTTRGIATAVDSDVAFRGVDAMVFRGVSVSDMETFYRVLLQMQENLQSEPEGRTQAI